MLDDVLGANEVVDFSTSENKDQLLVKFDFEKEYDMVNWYFLRYMLQRMGFGAIWLKWTKALVFSSQMSVLVNGSPTKDFVVERGLQQGDPISHFLFVVVVEGLAGLVRKTSEIGEFNDFSFHGLFRVDLLQFTHDTLFIGEGNWKNFWAIKSILRGFEIVSGLGVSFHKSINIGLNLNSIFWL